MKRFVHVMVMVMVAGLLSVFTAGVASAQCAPPDGATTIYKVTSKKFTYYPTNVYSNWASFRAGGTINYSENKTMGVSASVTATVSAEAGIVFAKASASLGVTVGASYSKAKTWSYTANVPADKKHKYRLHAYRYASDFTMTKKRWVGGTTCNFKMVSGWPQTIHHAPATGSDPKFIVWKLDKKAA